MDHRLFHVVFLFLCAAVQPLLKLTPLGERFLDYYYYGALQQLVQGQFACK